MINLKNIITQLEEEDYQKLLSQLNRAKADKFSRLLIIYREDQLSDEEIPETLKVNANAFYVLKSRLYEKLREYLINALTAPRVELLKKIATIPALVYDTQKDTAIAILTKLEKDLLQRDMPYELTGVYNALKKINIHSEKYYEYSQQYNKHVAYTLALDKAEDLLADFTKKSGDYYASRDESILELLHLIKKEMANVCRLYESHHLQVYQNILDVSFALFIPLPDAVKDDKPIEDILDETEKIFVDYPKDTNYQFLRNVLNFLTFEYYHKLNIYKKEAQYFDIVNDQLPNFLFYNHCGFTAKFLISRIERYVYLNMPGQLYEENKILVKKYEPDKNDVPCYITYMKYLAVSAYYAGKYDIAVKLLNELLNGVSFIKSAHFEIEVKMLLALCLSMNNKYDLAWTLIRNTSRKVGEMNKDGSYENAVVFIKMLKMTMGSKTKNVEEKLIPLKNRFELLNQGPKKLLEYINMDEKFIKKLAKPYK